MLIFPFGLPPERVIEQAHRQNIAVGVTATCVRVAQDIALAGADFVLARSWEAGGHRGSFDPSQLGEELPVFALVRCLQDCLSIPIVAAGGMMDGRDIAEVLAAGATAAQLGTALLCCDEAGTPPPHTAISPARWREPDTLYFGFQSVSAGKEYRKIRSMTVAKLMATIEQELSQAATRP